MKPRPSVAPAAAAAHTGVAWIASGLLVAATLLAYAHVWKAGFIWDDEMHLTQNPCIVGPLGLREIWTTSAARYFPLTLTTFWIEHALWGLNPLPYHGVNVLMHAASAVALWRVLARLEVPGAWLGAAFWALHPVQVETVAWVTELKNTQSCLFFLLSVHAFLGWMRPGPAGGRRSYALAVFWAALAMASKSSTVVLPVVLALCACWVEGGLRRATVIRLAPVFALSLMASALSLWTQHLEGANEQEWSRSVPERIAIAGKVVWFYLGKLAWPHPLIFVYPRWGVDARHADAFAPAACVVAVLALLWWRRHLLRAPLFAFSYFLVALVPVLGLVDQYFWRYSFVGDHFQYLASMGPLALLGAAVGSLPRKWPAWGGRAAAALAAAILTACGLIVTAQCPVYDTVESLWTATAARNPGCWMAFNNLGTYYLDKGRAADAAAQFRKAADVSPRPADAFFNLGNALTALGKRQEATDALNRALELDPRYEAAHINLGNLLLQSGMDREAAEHFEAALRINPGSADAENDLGNIELQNGRLAAAAARYTEALRLNRHHAEARTNLGAVLLQQGSAAGAVAEFQQVLDLQPSNTKALTNLGNALFQMGRIDAAKASFARALAIDPRLPEAHNNLGVLLVQQGHLDQAIEHYRKAIEAAPGYKDAHRNLSVALFKKGDIDGADTEFKRATGAP